MRTQRALGIDVGGTKIAAALYDASSWKVLKTHQEKTEAKKGMKTVASQIVTITRLLRPDDFTPVGVGVPGLVTSGGIVQSAPHIVDSQQFDLLTTLHSNLAGKIFIDNDSRCFTLAEATMGVGKGFSVVVGLTIGTGLGGGIVIDGRIFRGSDGFAGEFGHMLLMPGRVPYSNTDVRGDAEQYLSGTALQKRCTEASKASDVFLDDACPLLSPDIFREIALLLTSITHALNPSVFVFGGSVGESLRAHIPIIEKELTTWLLPNTPLPLLRIGNRKDSGTLGAALLTCDVKDSEDTGCS